MVFSKRMFSPNVSSGLHDLSSESDGSLPDESSTGKRLPTDLSDVVFISPKSKKGSVSWLKLELKSLESDDSTDAARLRL